MIGYKSVQNGNMNSNSMKLTLPPFGFDPESHDSFNEGREKEWK